jgi:hypothetical protein
MIETRMDIDWMVFMTATIQYRPTAIFRGINRENKVESDVFDEIIKPIDRMDRIHPLNFESLRSHYRESKDLGM